MELLETCPYCQSHKIEKTLESKDHFLTKETFYVFKCTACQVLFTNPRPDEKEIIKYYKSNNYISHGTSKSSLFDQLYRIIRSFSLQWKVRLIKELIDSGRILDYGCGTGAFLTECKKRKYITDGIEPSDRARTEAEKITKQKIYKTTGQAKNNKYEIITLWHVLEHVEDIRTTIKTLSTLLTDKGNIIIAVPNHESYDAHKYGTHWAAYDLPRHLWHFNRQAMTNILSDANFEITKIVPMKLDSYYVSLLSSKYLDNKGLNNYLNGIITGTISNLSAKRTKNYSSLIYIARPK